MRRGIARKTAPRGAPQITAAPTVQSKRDTPTFVGAVLELVVLIAEFGLILSLLHTDVHAAQKQPHEQAPGGRTDLLDGFHLAIQRHWGHARENTGTGQRQRLPVPGASAALPSARLPDSATHCLVFLSLSSPRSPLAFATAPENTHDQTIERSNVNNLEFTAML
jgi:hypothetical protein